MKLTRKFDMSNPIDRADLIRIELRDAGVTAADIAEELQVSKTFVGDVINSRRSSLRVQEHISTQIRRPVDVLWPRTRRSMPMT